ncbi:MULTISPECIES: cation:proton antiporter [Pseudanabaena]|uniref:Kef-type potassium/proton antiporter, CPA2 family n=2 Tax=Pseudanabaena TaxID=1152 RepID=L8N4N7_9CYAN|nr:MULTISPECIES: cation:proton antiporter [Pseudanabaena]ELS34094.1 Kef-type potassium/proton antiporter, CPA2 family [Pseudanabaena biceps PCC 7429]MDG3493682.1 cation:proton antiporter [Pseudanabaena catenata USMAC16]
MQEDFRLIVDLVTVLAAASFGGLLAAALRLPVLLGYIFGGIIVGPTGLGLIKELIQVETLAQFGVAFLLFALGVEFSLKQLNKVRAIALGGGTLQILLTIALTTVLSVFVGWVDTPVQGVFLGGILSLSSTAVVLRSLMETNETESAQGQVTLGMLIIQDLALGLMLAVLPALDHPETVGVEVVKALSVTALFAGGAIAAGIWLIPPFLRWVASTESRELFLLSVIVLCLGIALLTEHLGLSIEMGAFVAGLMISEVEYADQALTYVEPLRDVFATLFFAAIGMLIDPLFLIQNWELILSLVAIVMIGKFLIVVPLVSFFRYPLRVAIFAGLGLAQIGEFSFVLASEGQKLGLVSRRVYLLILGTTAVTLMVTPFLLKATPQILLLLEKVPLLKTWMNKLDMPQEISVNAVLKDHVVVCGYGRIGQGIVTLLQSKGYSVLVIEEAESKVQILRAQNIPYLYGNCASPLVLEKAEIDHARSMLIAISDPIATRLAVQRAVGMSPAIDIVARADKDADIDTLYQLGAKEVVHPTFEASLELSTHLLICLGEKSQDIQAEINAVRRSRYANFRPEIACVLPVIAPLLPPSSDLVEIDGKA